VDAWVEDSVLSGYTMLELNDATKDVEPKLVTFLQKLAMDDGNERNETVTFNGMCSDF
jgi:hypothetical protein